MEAGLAFLALPIAGYALIAARLERFSVGPALVFMAIGPSRLLRRPPPAFGVAACIRL